MKHYDGPWRLPEDLRKVSGLARYSWRAGSSRFSILGLAYRNSWNSSDQIPLRAVTDGLIGRFGTIDPTAGGATERYSLSGSWRHAGASSSQEVQVYGIHSNLSLFSNFGFFLDKWLVGSATTNRVPQAWQAISSSAASRPEMVAWWGSNMT